MAKLQVYSLPHMIISSHIKFLASKKFLLSFGLTLCLGWPAISSSRLINYLFINLSHTSWFSGYFGHLKLYCRYQSLAIILMGVPLQLGSRVRRPLRHENLPHWAEIIIEYTISEFRTLIYYFLSM